ncbi:MAG: HAD family hydrolase [Myxococcota bacterium]
MTSHILFDFFGTLVEYSASRTEQGYPRSFAWLVSHGAELDYPGFLELWSRTSSEFDRRAEASLREFSMGELGRAFLERALPRPPEDERVDAFVASYLAEWNKGVRFSGRTGALVARLAERYELAVVTNTHDPDLVPGHLEAMGLSGCFRRVFTSVELGTRKPHPEIFRHALRELDIGPTECVFVGDDLLADYRGARGAGIRGLLIDPERRAELPEADRLGSLLDLEAVLADRDAPRSDRQRRPAP